MIGWLPWTDAAVVAAATGTATVTLGGRRARWAARLVAWTRELTLMFALYGLWQLAGDHSLGDVGGAVGRGRRLWDLERAVGLPSERRFQAAFLGHHELLRLADFYYAQVHVPALGLCLVWLFVRHRDRYPQVRAVVVGVTAVSLAVQLVPVAPPRLVPGLGLVDTGRVIGPAVYPATAAPGLDQLSTMPSLHVGWALIVAGALVVVLRSRWRWLALLYPATTTVVVVVTGNHYWADALAAAAITAAVTALVAVLRVGSGRRDRHGLVAPARMPQGASGVDQVKAPARVARRAAGPSRLLRSEGTSRPRSQGSGSAAAPEPASGLGFLGATEPALPPRPR